MAIVGCRRDGLSREQRRARSAARHCYELLMKGRYAKFVGEMADAEYFSEDYRRQMEELVHEYHATTLARHRGLVSVVAVGDTLMGHQAHIYLQLTFADSTSEEVGVPMVLVDDKWKMR